MPYDDEQGGTYNGGNGTASKPSSGGGSYNSGTSGSKGGGASTQSPGAGSSVGKGSGTVGSGGYTSGAGGQRGAGSNYGPGSARPGGASMGGDTHGTGGTSWGSLGGGNKSGVGGPGAGGMGGQNVRNGSSTGNVGPNSGYSASGNVGGGKDASTGQMTSGIGRQAASIADSIEGMRTAMDSAWSTPSGTVGNTSSAKAQQLKDQYSQYRSPPGAAPAGVALDASIPGRVAAATPPGIDYSAFNLRGLTGPMGEPRVQPTAYGTNYQTAQMARDMYPGSIGQYSQEDVTNALGKISGALPGEADYLRYGDVADYMNNLARVSLNQMVGGFSPTKAASALDTTGMRSKTVGFDRPGPNSVGMTDNWGDPVKGDAYQQQAASALQDALFGRGVSSQAMSASNFVAEGTPMVRGVNEVGAPVNGTQFGEDPTWGNRIANRNTAAMASLGSAPSAVARDLQDRIAAENARTPTPASYSVADAFRPSPAGTYTTPYDRPTSAPPTSSASRTAAQGPSYAVGPDDFRAPPRSPTGTRELAGLPEPDLEPAMPQSRPPPRSDVDIFRSMPAGTLTTPYNLTGPFGEPRDPWHLGEQEKVLSVENVPEENPIQYDPPHTVTGKVAKTVVGGLSSLIPGWSAANAASKHFNGGLSIGDLAQRDIDGYFGMSDAQKAAYGERADARRDEQYDRERSGWERRPGAYQVSDNAYLPPPAAPPPGMDDGTGDDDGNTTSDWTRRNRNPNPADPYSYGMGPGYNYFTYV